jgi:sugar phosphate isomerase/epimerase
VKAAISNIAWPEELESQIAGHLARRGVRGVEIAPTRRWPDLTHIGDQDVRAYRRFWEDHGISIVALQALLYGRPELTIFESVTRRMETLAYCIQSLELARMLGASCVVFGSPKNRRAGAIPPSEVSKIATEFFEALGDAARANGIRVGLEANPPEYGADFLTSTAAVIEFVSALNNPGLGCHLDLGGMLIAGEEPSALIPAIQSLVHFHVSEPYLRPIGGALAAHRAAGAALHEAHYEGWVSIEMRTSEADPLGAVYRALDVVREAYMAADG